MSCGSGGDVGDARLLDRDDRAGAKLAWLKTRDLARCDGEGNYYIVDRSDDVIITKRLQRTQAENESVLSKHPAVQDVAVLDGDRTCAGQVVIAQVVLCSEQNATAEELAQLCRDNLPTDKVPRICLPIAPRNPAGPTPAKRCTNRLLTRGRNARLCCPKQRRFAGDDGDCRPACLARTAQNPPLAKTRSGRSIHRTVYNPNRNRQHSPGSSCGLRETLCFDGISPQPFTDVAGDVT